MENKYNKNTSIRLDPEIKGWLYTRCNNENRSLSNLINTVLKREKDAACKHEFIFIGYSDSHNDYKCKHCGLWAHDDKTNTQ